MSVATQDTAVSTGRATRALIYLVLILFALFYLLPLYVMGVNSLKPLEEITGGNMMALPQTWTLDPWRSAWSTAQIGVEPTGLKPVGGSVAGSDTEEGGIRFTATRRRSRGWIHYEFSTC